MTKKSRHTHRFVRVKTQKGTFIYKCDLPGCSYYIHAYIAEGRKSVCYRCGNEFFLNKANMDLARPHCADCTERKDDSTFDQFKELVDQLDTSAKPSQ